MIKTLKIKAVDKYTGEICDVEFCRYLKENEVVHHKNENKLDNRPENLEVMTTQEHIKLHAKKRKRDENGKFAI